MTDPQLQELRKLFPVTERFAYLDHASNGPLPTPTVRALTEYYDRFSRDGAIHHLELEVVVEEARSMVARLMQVRPEEIAFTRNTSSGIIIAIGSIDWHDGNNLIMMNDAFPANYYPFQLLIPQVEKRYVSSRDLASGPDCIFRLVDQRTRVVAIDWVTSTRGIRSDIAAIAEFCRPLGIRLIVDATQGMGIVDLDFSRVGADFVCFGANKWLFSPQGNGILYVNAATLPKLKPYNLGWQSARWEEFNDLHSLRPLKPDASRYEEGTKNHAGIKAMRESLRLLLEVGVASAAEHNRSLNDRLRKGLLGLGYEIHTPEEPRRSAGILSVDRPGIDTKLQHRKLADAGVICSLRENRLRIAPHFYNTIEETDRLLSVLAS
jgi:selenocysteine lyase/cysteine desulfurase